MTKRLSDQNMYYREELINTFVLDVLIILQEVKKECK